MQIALFYHSLISDWNHGNAHFLRGIATELVLRGHCVRVFEPVSAWSVRNLLSQYGAGHIQGFKAAYPHIESIRYDPLNFEAERELEHCELIIVHEWNDPGLIKRMGNYRKQHAGCRLLFHDTHHRSVTDPGSLAGCDLSGYDGVLAYGDIIRRIYVQNSWCARAWTWHEAADIRVFRPFPEIRQDYDIVWIGNWGDDERTAELQNYFIQPVQELGLRARAYGVRYPDAARELLAKSGISYGGWLPNYEAPKIFARFRATVHIPRRPYVDALPGIPTIRPFEALACGIPLLCSPWNDTEGLFAPGKDFLLARDSADMKRRLRDLLHDAALRRELAEHGLRTVRERHTCRHRVDELLAISESIGLAGKPQQKHCSKLEN